MNIFFNSARMKVLAGLFTNLAAGWIGLVIITLPVPKQLSPESIAALTFDVLLATLCVLIAFELEKKSIL